MTLKQAAVTGVLLAAVVVTGQRSPAPESGEAHASARIGDVAWIAGHWTMEKTGSQLEETWAEPSGDCMMGMFRWVKQGKVWIYELLTIREEAGTLVFRFRHFGDDLASWEPKTEPLTYWLSSIKKNEAVFTNPDSDSHRHYSFTLSDDAKTMTIRVGAFRDGEIQTSDFRYTRS
ncbi:MAG: DUF6265 family protein [Phycisphaerae bacterium]|jgi:hypothetical protein